MARVTFIEGDSAEGRAKEAFEYHLQKSGVVTNMKKALLNSMVVYDAYIPWYPLYEKVIELVGERAAIIFAHAISTTNECALCSLFFISDLRELGEDPNNFTMNEKEEMLSRLGHQMVKNPNEVSDELFAKLKQTFTDEELVILVGFAGQMIAYNNFNSVLRIDLDQRLLPMKDDFKPGNWRTEKK